MYLEKRALKDVPANAVILSPREAYYHYINRIFDWKNSSDVWPFKIGIPLLTGVVYMTNYAFLYYFRRRYKISNQMKILSYLICAGAPTITSGLLHLEMVVQDIVLGDKCVACIYSKAFMIQFMFSLGYGLIVTPLVTTAIAIQKFTIDIPGWVTHEDRLETFKIYQNFLKRIVFRIGILAFLNAASVIFLVYKESEAFDNFIVKLKQNEKEIAKFSKEFEDKSTK